MNNNLNHDKFKVIVIGAGQAGLSTGYFLKKNKIDLFLPQK